MPVAPGLEDTPEIRQQMADRVLTHFEQITGEQIRPYLGLQRIFSINDFQADYHACKGTALGLAHTLGQTAVFRPQHRSIKLSNLFYTGQYNHPGVGVPMVLISDTILYGILKGIYQ